MKPNLRIIILNLCLSAIFLLIGCNKSEEPSVYNPDLVFPNSFEIHVKPYVYTDSTDQKTYQVKGDTTSIVGAQPLFQWKKVPSNIITVALFNKAIQVSGGEIENPEDIIWQWHSSMESKEHEVDGDICVYVQYQQGNPVINKKIQYSTQPLPLESGLYNWAVWSWNNGGQYVLYSSKPLKFRVE